MSCAHAKRRPAQVEHVPPLFDPRFDPLSNRLLAAMSQSGCEDLLPLLEPVYLRAETVLHEPGGAQRYAYFPASCLVCFVTVLEDGSATEFAMSGNEGMAGLPMIMGTDRTTTRTVVLQAGLAYRIESTELVRQCERGGVVLHVLLRYAYALTEQIAQTGACNRHHSVEKKLCSWLLMCLDRLPCGDLAMTHERIAVLLGVRREGITAAAGSLRALGGITSSRGHIAVLDRARLEQSACECYATVRDAYEGLFPSGPSAAPRVRPEFILKSKRKTIDSVQFARPAGA